MRGGVGEHGASFIELVVALALASTMMGLAVPVTASSIDAGRARHATGFLASHFRTARQHALFSSHASALVFDQVATRWVFRVCEDGNGNGLRRSDIQAGRDICTEGPYDVAEMFPGIQVAVDPVLPGPGGEPGSADAVRFGRGDVASFSPEGTGTAGTVFLRSSGGPRSGRAFGKTVSVARPRLIGGLMLPEPV